MTPIDVSPKDPLHQRSGPGMAWSIANTSEALPGVLTPLGWTFWQPQLNLALRSAYYNLGAFSSSELAASADPLENFGAIFCGRYTASVELLRKVADRLPGTSADRVELAILGEVREGVADHHTRRRYPFVALRLPRTALLLPRRIRTHRAQLSEWWRTAAFAPVPWPQGRAEQRFVEAQARFRAVMADHAAVTLVGQMAYTRVAELAKRAGVSPDDLVTGAGSLEEASMLRDVWSLGQDRLAVDTFVARHGYHGPRAGAIDVPSWREDPSTLAAYVQVVKRRSDQAGGPDAMLAERARRSQQARAQLLRDLPAHQRPAASSLTAAARTLLPLREVGKAAFLYSIDVVRAAARAKGEALVRAGLLEDADDVFYLTADEFVQAELPDDAHDLIAFRRARRALYQTLDLPQRWIGDPEPVPAGDGTPRGAEPLRTGTPVSAGVVVGRARVVREPHEDELAPGEILVCRTTDPAWAPLLFSAAAVVTEIGGPLSHGAIIARELGLPAVVNLGGATMWVETGELIRVNGGTGVVERLDPTASEGDTLD